MGLIPFSKVKSKLKYINKYWEASNKISANSILNHTSSQIYPIQIQWESRR